MVVGLFLAIGVWWAIYMGIERFQPAAVLETQTKKVDKTIDAAKKDAQNTQKKWEALLQSGKQMLQSGADSAIASWQALLNQKKLEAEQYLQNQKNQLKEEAKAAVQAEAKNQIDKVFKWR